MYKNELKKRYRIFSGVRNYKFDIHDADGNLVSNISIDEWKQSIIETFQKIDNAEIWFIFHDKDIISATDTEEEKIKPIHCHFVLKSDNARWPQSVMKSTGTNEREIEKVNSISGTMRYLTHTTDKSMNDSKYRYGISELYFFKNGVKIDDDIKREEYTSRIVGKEAHTDKENEFINEVLVAIVDGKILESEIREVFIKEFGKTKGIVVYLKKIKEIEKAVREYRKIFLQEKMKVNGRRLTTIYLEGDSNAGKTTIASTICGISNLMHGFPEENTHKSSSKGKGVTYDPFQSYNNQYSTILDELMPETAFGFSDFNLVFDRNGAVEVSSRHYNTFWLSDLCCIVKSRSLGDAINALIASANADDRKDPDNAFMQIARRIPLNLIVSTNHVSVRKFNILKRRYEKIGDFNVDLENLDSTYNFCSKLYDIIESVEGEKSKLVPLSQVHAKMMKDRAIQQNINEKG